MGKKRKRKNNPKRKAQHEQRKHDGHKGHMSNILIYVLPIFGGLLLGIASMIYSTQRIPAIWMVFTASVLFAFAGCLYWQQIEIAEIENPPFAVSISILMAAEVRDSTFFAVCNRAAPRFLSPIPLLIFMDINNRQKISADINQLKIEIKLKDRAWIFPRWLKTVFIPEQFTLLSYAPPTTAKRVELLGGDGRLDTILGTAPMQPNKTMRGWVVLDAPAEFQFAPRPLIFRITIKDTAGHSFTTLVPSPNDVQGIGPTPKIRVLDVIDISGLPVMHWVDSK
jgi:hypothetical protein